MDDLQGPWMNIIFADGGILAAKTGNSCEVHNKEMIVNLRQKFVSEQNLAEREFPSIAKPLP